MKKLFVLVAIFGMGAYLAGCGGEDKPAPKTGTGGAMGGPAAGGASTGPKAGAAADADKDKDMDDKGGKDDGDKDDGDKEEK